MLYFITRERYSEEVLIAMLVRHTLVGFADAARCVPTLCVNYFNSSFINGGVYPFLLSATSSGVPVANT